MASQGLALSSGGMAADATEHPLLIRLWGGPLDRHWRAERSIQSDKAEQIAPFIKSLVAIIQTSDGKIKPVSSSIKPSAVYFMIICLILSDYF